MLKKEQVIKQAAAALRKHIDKKKDTYYYLSAAARATIKKDDDSAAIKALLKFNTNGFYGCCALSNIPYLNESPLAGYGFSPRLQALLITAYVLLQRPHGYVITPTTSYFTKTFFTHLKFLGWATSAKSSGMYGNYEVRVCVLDSRRYQE